MSESRKSSGGCPKSHGEAWLDLIAVAVLSILACGVVVKGGGGAAPLRIALGLPLLGFLPGYAVVAALFPRKRRAESERTNDSENAGTATPSGIRDRGVDAVERAALSVGLSVAIVPLSGLALDYLVGIRLLPVVATVTGLTLFAAAVAAARRARLPPADRFSVPYRGWIATARSETVDSRSRADVFLSALVVLGLLVAASSIVYAVSAPTQQTGGAELSLMTENESGELVAEDYPETIDRAGDETLHVGVTHRDPDPQDYTLIVQIERVEAADDGGLRVLEREQLHRSEMTLDRGESWELGHAADPEMSGEELRLSYLLFEGDPPAEEDRTPDDAHRSVSLRVDVP